MLVLVLNAGSSSLKYQLIDIKKESVISKGVCERIGIDGRVKHICRGEKFESEVHFSNHRDALNEILRLLTSGEGAAVSKKEDIGVIGHRLVCGLEKYSHAVPINEESMNVIESAAVIAPLHSPAMIAVINACSEIFGEDTFQAATFDTAFHLTMPKKAFMYALPYEYYEKYGIRKFGYHGTSIKYVARRYMQLTKSENKDAKVVVCHIGNGSSVAAVRAGMSVDTTMGYTPLDGLIMGTRCGSIDPAIIFHIADREGIEVSEVEEILNKKSGFLGVTGISSDDRDIERAAYEGNARAVLARQMLYYQIKKYVGSYAAVMNGLDALIFTGGIGEKSADLRSAVCKDMSYLGLSLDEEKNIKENGQEIKISEDHSKVGVYIIPTNEELMIARDAYEAYQKERENIKQG